MKASEWVAIGLLSSCALAGALRGATLEVKLEQQSGAPLSEAVVAAYPIDAKLPSTAPTVAIMDQRDRRFVPHILAVQTKTHVSFPNSDSVSHHVYSFSKAGRFQIYLTRGQPAKEVVFDQPGVVTLGCNLHDWMLGYILVLDTPYFVSTDSAGAARLERLPPGRYRFEVWHPRITDGAALLQRELELADASPASWTLRLSHALLVARDQRPGLSGY
ncbi:MAG: methylamine utilization protein [Acidobacteriota bacterium]